MKFVKQKELQLLNGGYVSDKDGNPISNSDFIHAQRRAEYVVTFAKLAKGKNFTKTKVDSIKELTAEVMDAISKKNEISFVDAPKKPKLTTKTKLAEEALAFVKYGEDVEKVSQINEFLSEFEILKDFEDHGLFFDEGVVKLNKVYTLKEVVDAVTETIDIIK